jgi:hypothetical protein
VKRFEYEDAIDKSGLPGIQRAVLRHVVRRAVCQGGDLGTAWPSAADIVACTGFGRTAVKGALAKLRKVARRPTPGREATHTGSRDGPGRETTTPGSRDDHHLVARRPPPGRETTTEAFLEAFLEASQKSVDPPGPTPPEQPTLVEAKPMLDVHWQAALGLWNQFLQASGRSPSGGPSKSSKTGQALLRALRADHDEMLDALRWAAFGDDWSARKNLRGNKGCTIMTPIRHRDRYAALWREHGDAHIADGDNRDRGADALRKALDEISAPAAEEVADGVTYEEPDAPKRTVNDDFWL